MWHDDEILEGGGCIPNCQGSCEGCDPEPGEGRAEFNAKYGHLLADPRAKERYLAGLAEKEATVLEIPPADAVPEAVEEEDETLPISGFCRDCQRSFPTLREAHNHKCEGRAAG